MPKNKSHKGLLKRARITGRKKIAFSQTNRGHLRSGKGGKRLRQMRQKAIAKRGDMRRLQKMLQMRLKPVDETRLDRPAADAKAST